MYTRRTNTIALYLHLRHAMLAKLDGFMLSYSCFLFVYYLLLLLDIKALDD